MRVPAVAHWPGAVPAGRVLPQLAQIVDLFPTLLALAAAPPPRGTRLDGVDLAPLLRGARHAAHANCSFFYGGTPEAGCDTANRTRAAARCPGLWAVRCGAHKGHWVTRGGQRVAPVLHSQRLLFNVLADPAERSPVRRDSAEARHAWARIDAAVAAHRGTLPGAPGVPPVVNQVALGQRAALGACCAPADFPRSLPAERLRRYPPCTCSAAHFHVAQVCRPVVPPCPPGASRIAACNNRRRRVVPAELERSFDAHRAARGGGAHHNASRSKGGSPRAAHAPQHNNGTRSRGTLRRHDNNATRRHGIGDRTDQQR